MNRHHLPPTTTSQDRRLRMTTRHKITFWSSKSQRWGIGAKKQGQPTPVSTELLVISHFVLEKKALVFTMTAKSLCPWTMALAQATKRSARVGENESRQNFSAGQGLAGQRERSARNNLCLFNVRSLDYLYSLSFSCPNFIFVHFRDFSPSTIQHGVLADGNTDCSLLM